MLAKRNPWRFNFCLDPQDPVHQKVCNIINTIPRFKKVPFIVKCIVIAIQNPVSPEDWPELQRDFLNSTISLESVLDGTESKSTESKTESEKRKSPGFKEEVKLEAAPVNEEKAPAAATETPPKNPSESAPELNIVFNADEEDKGDDMDEFMKRNLEAFGVNF